MQTYTLTLLPNQLAICRLPAGAAIPPWAMSALHTDDFSAITRTRDELSVVCAQDHVPAAAREQANTDDDRSSGDSAIWAPNSAGDGAPDARLRVDADWRVLRVEGPFAFTVVGVLATLASALAEANVSLFAISTFDTDYLLVKANDVDAAIQALSVAGHRIEGGDKQT